MNPRHPLQRQPGHVDARSIDVPGPRDLSFDPSQGCSASLPQVTGRKPPVVAVEKDVGQFEVRSRRPVAFRFPFQNLQ